ncbi:hypothetical protein B5K06_26100 [Rhizobium grahamii]|uniref:YjiS-like domain-containing protein n=1 Tax=Rhizobium grahamii TaxID=1120045 RepID=A0A370KJ44_9HYPH|nr:hypothetical protein B5K06_26100 [Rhizobium grahamii]
MRRRWRLVSELGRTSDRSLHDLGINRGEIERIARAGARKVLKKSCSFERSPFPAAAFVCPSNATRQWQNTVEAPGEHIQGVEARAHDNVGCHRS